jgi:hypothetical protein
MLANFEMNLSWRDLVHRTANETLKDDAQGLASQLAYYFFLALFPALLCLLISLHKSAWNPTVFAPTRGLSRRYTGQNAVAVSGLRYRDSPPQARAPVLAPVPLRGLSLGSTVRSRSGSDGARQSGRSHGLRYDRSRT